MGMLKIMELSCLCI